MGAEVLEIPFIEIRKPRSFQPLDKALKNLRSFSWLILTSVNGVEAMWERMSGLRLSNHQLQHLAIVAIGPATKKAIEKHGLKVALVPQEYVAESVVRSLQGQVRGKRVLLIRAKVARDVIPRELRTAGAHVEVVEAYETVVPQSSRRRLQAALRSPNRKPDFITFTSSSTVRNFMTLLGHEKDLGRQGSTSVWHGVRLASIGPVTSRTMRECGLRVDIEAREYSMPGLVQAIVDACQP